MIQIICKEETYQYNIFHIVKAFYPSIEVEQVVHPDSENAVEILFDENASDDVLAVKAEFIKQQSQGEKKIEKYLLDKEVYSFLEKRTGRSLAWGLLTGVRPTKIAMQKVEEGMDKDSFAEWFKEDALVSEEKATLAYDIAKREREILSVLDYENGYSLYVGIPFCPSVCSYCSFSSGPLSYWKDSVDDYVDALCKELRAIGDRSKEKRLNTIYIGGGTPTTLTEEQLERLLGCIDETFSREHLKEYTVEAGRPDSITEGKLRVIRAHDVTRISINPQTMQQSTLDRIGRNHTVQDIIDTYELARTLGFDNINMDLIAGLPGETAEDMENTLQQIRKLQPDSLTVHSLAIKRAAKMGQQKSTLGYVEDLREQMSDLEKMERELTKMIHVSYETAKEMGLVPYYLYRQKNIAGNFENVGYAKVDKAGIYNILIMEEKQSIVAAGAGASTKIVLPEPMVVPGSKNGKKTTLMRVENVKSIRDYILRIDEMIERKGEWLWR